MSKRFIRSRTTNPAMGVLFPHHEEKSFQFARNPDTPVVQYFQAATPKISEKPPLTFLDLCEMSEESWVESEEECSGMAECDEERSGMAESDEGRSGTGWEVEPEAPLH